MLKSLLVFFLFSTTSLLGQYTFMTNIQGQTGIDVDVTITFHQVVVNSNDCNNGFNYQIRYDYDVQYNQFGNGNGNNDLNTLQGYLACGSGNQSFFDLPTGGGSGSSETANNWTFSTNCYSAQVQDLMCNEIDLVVQGPGVGNQTLRLEAISSLPVEFIDFTAESSINGNLLNWSTASEKNNDYFTIERSIDGKNWELIKTVNGAGTTSEKSEYSFKDESISEITYYRLKQFDYDGTETELKVVSVNSKYAEEISAFPNPSVDFIIVKGINSASELVIINAMGLDQTSRVSINQINGGFQLNVSNLSKGAYFLKTASDNMRIIKN